ncbi:hypothetical protein KR018_002285 [Drosophila ironensis]|nr:hypothetical protein KR018_002285 [Drosophila ironensis]
MSWNKRNTSHISIYNYPEHLNPFYEDDNHKRLRFWGFGKKKNENGKHSLSIGNLQELWKTYSFRKKKSSTLGINKTSESPPTLRRDLNDSSYLNSRIFRGDRHTSLQDIDTRRESDLSGMYFNRNDRYRSTTQFSGYSSPTQHTIRSSQSSLTSTNPFESELDSCPNSPRSPRKYRKKRRAPPPPPRKTGIQDYIATKDIESLASEIEEYVNNRNESLINAKAAKEAQKSNQNNIETPVPSVSIRITESEPNPSTAKSTQVTEVKQTNGSVISTHINRVARVEIVPAPDTSTKPNTSPVTAKQSNESAHASTVTEAPPQVTAPIAAIELNPPCTSHSQQCNAVHVRQTNEPKSLGAKRKQNGVCPVDRREDSGVVEKQSVIVSLRDSKSVSDRSVVVEPEATLPSKSEVVERSESDATPSTSRGHTAVEHTDNSNVKLVNEPVEDLEVPQEPQQEKKTNSFGTVKQISQIFEENISSSVPKPVVKETAGASSPPTQSEAQPEPNVLQIREDFELERPVRLADRFSFDRPMNRSTISEERESNGTPTPRMRKKKSIKEVLESISRNQKLLNESAAKGTKVYMTPSYTADNKYYYPNELNSVNIRSSKEVTEANISVPSAEANNIFISKITKFKGQYRESSPTSSNLDWNPLPKPNRAHNPPNPNYTNGNVNNNNDN